MPWGIAEVSMVALVFVLLWLGAAVLLAAIIGTSAQGTPVSRPDTRLLLVAQLAIYACLLGVIALAVRGNTGNFWEALRWNWPVSSARFFFGGSALALVISVLSALLPIPKQLPIDEIFQDQRSIWFLAIFGTLIAPFVEEVLFRGFVFPGLIRSLGVGSAALLSSLVFALLHGAQLGFSWVPLLLMLAVGLALTIVRWKANSVAASTLVHMGYNFALFAMLFLATRGFTDLTPLKR